MKTYRLAFGNDAGRIEGTAREICEILDDYPEVVLLEVLASEKMERTAFYPILLRYVSRRLVGG